MIKEIAFKFKIFEGLLYFIGLLPKMKAVLCYEKFTLKIRLFLFVVSIHSFHLPGIECKVLSHIKEKKTCKLESDNKQNAMSICNTDYKNMG